ncbi:MAG: RNA polymerase sigma factor [Acidobacteriota bacterium]
MSCDAAFEQLYEEYGSVVLGWLAVRVAPAAVDDLFQDVWLIFYARWRRWQFPAAMESPEARPVLSFLFRTCQYVVQGHRRLVSARARKQLDEQELADSRSAPDRLLRQVELGRCLSLARKVCPTTELDVLLAKLAGVPAREIARALGVTEAMVDHRYRSALARLRKEMKLSGRGRGRRDHG